MKTLQKYFDSQKTAPDLQQLIFSLLWAGADFYEFVLFRHDFENSYSGELNKTGDKQLKVDVTANNYFVDALRKNGNVSLIASEELAEPIEGESDGKYVVAFDPLDGSSIVDANFSVGAIIGIYEGNSLIGRTGSEQVASFVFTYGSQFTFFLTTGQGTIAGIYRPGDFPDKIVEDQKMRDQFFILTEKVTLTEDGKYFAPGNLRAAANEKWYMKALQEWIKENYTLRYSGGMVPDIGHILTKGGGIFLYPGTSQKPDGKLRLLYECAPFAFIVEQAGGVALNQKGERILDIPVEFPHQTTPIFIGSKNEVEKILSKAKL